MTSSAGAFFSADPRRSNRTNDESDSTEHGGSTVDLDVVVRDGVAGRHVPRLGGFPGEELRAFAEDRDWEIRHRRAADDRRTYSFLDPGGLVSVQVDSPTHIAGRVVANVRVQGPADKTYTAAS